MQEEIHFTTCQFVKISLFYNLFVALHFVAIDRHSAKIFHHRLIGEMPSYSFLASEVRVPGSSCVGGAADVILGGGLDPPGGDPIEECRGSR